MGSAEDTDSTTGISTQTLGEEVFASTIQASVLGHEHARRARRSRDRALDPRDQRGDPALVVAEEILRDPCPMSSLHAHARPCRRTPLRPVRITRHYTKHAEGSVLVAFGDTKVLCTASVEEKVPPHKRGSGEGWVTAEYGMLPRATHTRGDREAARGKQSGRTQEIQRLIGRSLRAVFDLAALGERTITLDCDVLQADGGTRTAAITGAFVAAHDAVSWLMAQGKLAARRSATPSRRCRSASSTARRCSTSTTPKTRPATPT